MIATETDPGASFERSAKKPKLGSHGRGDVCSTPLVELKPEKKKKTKGDKYPVSEIIKAKDKKRKKQAADPVVSENDHGGDTVEASDRDQSSCASEEDDSGYIPPIHESSVPRTNSDSLSKKSKKYVPPEETPNQRDSRTIFVGNVPFQAMTSKVG